MLLLKTTAERREINRRIFQNQLNRGEAIPKADGNYTPKVNGDNLTFNLGNIEHGVVGKFRWQVIDGKTQKVIRSAKKWQKNLILDQGIDQYFSHTGGGQFALPQYFQACAVGTGSDPTYRDSGAITATVSGTTVTASAAFFVDPDDVGRLINFDGGAGQGYIQSVTSPTQCELTAPLTVGTPTLFTIWYVNQVQLTTEVKRTTTYLSGAANTGSTFSATGVTHKFTYDFSVEVSNQNYAELGWSYLATAGANLFSRTLIAGGTVTVLTGQQLRVIYSVSVTLTPNTATAADATIAGWPVAPATDQHGSGILWGMSAGGGSLGYVNSSGGILGGQLDPGGGVTFGLGTGTALPVSINAGEAANSRDILQSGAVTWSAYVGGSFTRSFSVTIPTGSGNSTGIRIIEAYHGYAFLFDQAQTKDNLHQLQLTLSVSMNRILTNP